MSDRARSFAHRSTRGSPTRRQSRGPTPLSSGRSIMLFPTVSRRAVVVLSPPDRLLVRAHPAGPEGSRVGPSAWPDHLPGRPSSSEDPPGLSGPYVSPSTTAILEPPRRASAAADAAVIVLAVVPSIRVAAATGSGAGASRRPLGARSRRPTCRLPRPRPLPWSRHPSPNRPRACSRSRSCSKLTPPPKSPPPPAPE